MRKELFEELLESVKQAVAIERGRMKPSRSLTVSSKNEVQAVRAKLALSHRIGSSAQRSVHAGAPKSNFLSVLLGQGFLFFS